MKNYYFERDLMRKMEKLERDLQVCYLFAAYENISEVAKRLGMSRNTVSNIISDRCKVENGELYFKINLSAELPRNEMEIGGRCLERGDRNR